MTLDEQIVNQFKYDPITGILFRKGKPSGTITSGGYMQVRIKNKLYMVHRVIWFLVHGSWPIYDIDHKDHNRTNNKLVNLRDIPQEANNAHKVTNKSGYSGIYENKKNTNRPWMVQVYSKGIYLTQKSFADLDEAIKHRDAIRKANGLTQL